MTIKLVCLEIVIVSIATRAMLALLGKPPPIPDALWACVTLGAVITALLMIVYEVIVAAKARTVHPPHIPLDRIGPFRSDEVAARGGDHKHHRSVSLN